MTEGPPNHHSSSGSLHEFLRAGAVQPAYRRLDRSSTTAGCVTSDRACNFSVLPHEMGMIRSYLSHRVVKIK